MAAKADKIPKKRGKRKVPYVAPVLPAVVLQNAYKSIFEIGDVTVVGCCTKPARYVHQLDGQPVTFEQTPPAVRIEVSQDDDKQIELAYHLRSGKFHDSCAAHAIDVGDDQSHVLQLDAIKYVEFGPTIVYYKVKVYLSIVYTASSNRLVINNSPIAITQDRRTHYIDTWEALPPKAAE